MVVTPPIRQSVNLHRLVRVAARVAVALTLHSAVALAQLPSAVRREMVEWADSSGTKTSAVMWSPMSTTTSLPTLLFSPGFGQVPAAYSIMLSTWASRGYVVVAIQHPAFKDPNAMELFDASAAIASQLVGALDHIVRDRLAFSRVDPTRVGIVGHSIGGSAAAQACSMESQFRACMDLDGTIFGSVVHTGMKQAFFLLRKTVAPPSAKDPPLWYENRDQANLHEDSVWAHTKTMYWLDVNGLDHMSFTDAALNETQMQEFKEGLGFRLPTKRAQEMTTRYVLDFFDAYLSGVRRSANLTQSPFPKTSLRFKR